MLHSIINSKNTSSGKNSLALCVILIFIIFGFASCNNKEERVAISQEIVNEDIFPYDLQNPDDVFYLPGYLDEISGISCSEKNEIVCIQDEEAIIYIFDTEKRKVTSKYDFGKDGDYEDIAIVDENAYVLRSDGTIFKVKDFEGKLKTLKIKTSLDIKNNTEGLVYHKNSNSLLISCKDSPSINKIDSYAGKKAIYRYDLNMKRFFAEPAYLLDLSKTEYMTDRGKVEKFFIELAVRLKLSEGDNGFHPSALAIHPIDEEDIYIISSVENLLIRMDDTGLIKDVTKLDSRIFNQPEGICFSENGDLFISNEGKNGSGNILKFNLKQK